MRDRLTGLAVGAAVAGLGVLGHVIPINWKSTATSRDTAYTNEPIPVDIFDGDAEVALLSPDGNGTAQFPVREYLQSIRDTLHDSWLTARAKGPDTSPRSFLLTRSAIVGAREEQRAELAREAEERRAELAQQAQEERERLEAEEQAAQEKREEERRAAAALDNIVASLDEWDRAQMETQFKYADAGFQYLTTTGNVAKTLNISSYGDFLALPLRLQVWTVRELVRTATGKVQGLEASLCLQQMLHIPAYLAEKILR